MENRFVGVDPGYDPWAALPLAVHPEDPTRHGVALTRERLYQLPLPPDIHPDFPAPWRTPFVLRAGVGVLRTEFEASTNQVRRWMQASEFDPDRPLVVYVDLLADRMLYFYATPEELRTLPDAGEV